MRGLLCIVCLLAMSVSPTQAVSTHADNAPCLYFPWQLNHLSLIVSNPWIGTEFDANSQLLYLNKSQASNLIAMNHSTRLTEKVVAVLPFSINSEKTKGSLLSAQVHSIAHPSLKYHKAS